MKRVAYLMALPSVILFFLFPAASIYLVGHLSLFKSDYLNYKFVGVLNYVTILQDAKFWTSVLNGLFYCAAITPMVVIIALAIAFLACEFPPKIQNAVKFALYIPVLTAGIIIANVWKWIFAPTGVVNWLIGLVGLGPWPWLTEATLAKLSISITMSSTVFGIYLIMILASIMAIPKQLFEAARIDGASPLQIKLRIVLPIIMPTILLIVMFLIIQSMQIWEFVWMMTSGGPAGGSATPAFNIYETAFTYGQYGLASAKSLILMLIILLVVLIQKRIERWSR